MAHSGSHAGWAGMPDPIDLSRASAATAKRNMAGAGNVHNSGNFGEKRSAEIGHDEYQNVTNLFMSPEERAAHESVENQAKLRAQQEAEARRLAEEKKDMDLARRRAMKDTSNAAKLNRGYYGADPKYKKTPEFKAVEQSVMEARPLFMEGCKTLFVFSTDFEEGSDDTSFEMQVLNKLEHALTIEYVRFHSLNPLDNPKPFSFKGLDILLDNYLPYMKVCTIRDMALMDMDDFGGPSILSGMHKMEFQSTSFIGSIKLTLPFLKTLAFLDSAPHVLGDFAQTCVYCPRLEHFSIVSMSHEQQMPILYLPSAKTITFNKNVGQRRLHMYAPKLETLFMEKCPDLEDIKFTPKGIAFHNIYNTDELKKQTRFVFKCVKSCVRRCTRNYICYHPRIRRIIFSIGDITNEKKYKNIELDDHREEWQWGKKNLFTGLEMMESDQEDEEDWIGYDWEAEYNADCPPPKRRRRGGRRRRNKANQVGGVDTFKQRKHAVISQKSRHGEVVFCFEEEEDDDDLFQGVSDLIYAKPGSQNYVLDAEGNMIYEKAPGILGGETGKPMKDEPEPPQIKYGNDLFTNNPDKEWKNKKVDINKKRRTHMGMGNHIMVATEYGSNEEAKVLGRLARDHELTGAGNNGNQGVARNISILKGKATSLFGAYGMDIKTKGDIYPSTKPNR